MKKIPFLFFLLFLFSTVSLKSQTESAAINSANFYKVFASNDIKLIDSELTPLLKANKAETNAFAGALLMKKANLAGSVIDKLEFFKNGKKLLEAAIERFPNKYEYYFLRLVIQENCPDFLNYNNELSSDSKIVIDNFKLFPAEVKKAIIDYSKTSKVLPSSKLHEN